MAGMVGGLGGCVTRARRRGLGLRSIGASRPPESSTESACRRRCRRSTPRSFLLRLDAACVVADRVRGRGVVEGRLEGPALGRVARRRRGPRRLLGDELDVAARRRGRRLRLPGTVRRRAAAGRAPRARAAPGGRGRHRPRRREERRRALQRPPALLLVPGPALVPRGPQGAAALRALRHRVVHAQVHVVRVVHLRGARRGRARRERGARRRRAPPSVW
jgi:hypothetical protein